MIYALSLADENPSVVPPTKETTIRSSSASPNPASPNPASPNPASPNPASPNPASLQHEFLSKPPPAPASPQPESAPISPEPHSTKTSFPSSFAAGKKSAARLAAVQASQASGKAAGFRPGKPGRSASAAPKKPSTTWNSDSDDEEDEDNRNEEDEEDEEDAEEAEEEDERLKKYRLPTAIPRSVSERGLQPNQARQNLNQLQASREGTYSMYSTSGNPQDGRPMSQAVNQGTEVGQFPNPASRREIPAVLRDQPAEPAENDPSLRPAFSQHGLLHRVMQERQEKSAKSTQEAAHRSGEPLLHVNHKPPPIQSGLLGAIASHERDRKRDGGMGAVLTLRAREQAMRQRENDELQRQSMMMMAGAPGAMGYPAAGYPNGMMNQAAMMQMMYNPQMMAAGGMMGGGATYEQLLFQQHQMQLQQQAYAQQCYMAPYGYPAVGQQGPMMPNGGMMNQGMPNGGMMSAHQSMYGFPMQQQQQQQQQVAFQQALPHQSFSAPTPPFVAQNPLSPSSPSLSATHPNNPKSNSSSSNAPSVKNNPANNQYNYHP